MAVGVILLLLTAQFPIVSGFSLAVGLTIPAVIAGVCTHALAQPGPRSTFNPSWARSWRIGVAVGKTPSCS